VSWPYLESELFQSRYVLAAFFLRGLPLVIELGGYKTPVTCFLEPGQVGVVLDGLLEPGMVGRHYHLAERFPPRAWPVRLGKPYGVLLLGLELHLTEEHWEALYELLRGAERIVIGVPVQHVTSTQQLKKILENVELREVLTVGLDLRGNKDCGDYAERRLHVLEPC